MRRSRTCQAFQVGPPVFAGLSRNAEDEIHRIVVEPGLFNPFEHVSGLGCVVRPIHEREIIVEERLYADAQSIHAERTNKTSSDDGSLYWAVDVVGSIAFAAWNIRKRGGEITYDAFHYIQRVAGHQLQITNADRSRTFAGIYLHETRLYIVEATVPPRSAPPIMFQQSLVLFDEEGDTFNYDYIHHPRLRIGGG